MAIALLEGGFPSEPPLDIEGFESLLATRVALPVSKSVRRDVKQECAEFSNAVYCPGDCRLTNAFSVLVDGTLSSSSGILPAGKTGILFVIYY